MADNRTLFGEDVDGPALALAQAKLAYERDEVPVGAVMIKDGQVIAEAHNLKETRKDSLAHAELLAIQAAQLIVGDWRLTGCTLVVTLEPCIMCMGALLHARVDRVIYGLKDSKWGACGSVVDLVSRKVVNHQLICEYHDMPEARELMQRFFKQRRG